MRRAGKGRLAAVFRVGMVILFLQTTGGLWWAHTTRARATELLGELGSHVMTYAGADHHDQPRTLYLNGASLRLSVGSADETVSRVLDDFQAQCSKRSGRLGVMRRDEATHGWVACLDIGGEPLRPAELWRRVQRFSETGDVSEIGTLRYVRAERAAGTAKTTFVAFFNSGPLNIRRMFPASGDAPGRDPSTLPRPPETRRILSSWEKGREPALDIYTTEKHAPTWLMSHYRDVLRASGWALHEPRDDTRPGTATPAFMAERAGEQLVITAGGYEDDAFVTVAKLR